MARSLVVFEPCRQPLAQVAGVDFVAGDSPHVLPNLFDEHEIQVMLHVLPITGNRTFGSTVLRTAHQLDVDMLVMGAFVHPIRGLILGGVTRYMLAHADWPVLMRR